jgi:hypothetical protein
VLSLCLQPIFHSPFILTGTSVSPPFPQCLTLILCFSHDDMHTIHHRDVSPETLKRYSRVVGCLLLFVLRCHRGWDSEYSMKLTAAQTNACQALLGSLLAQKQSTSNLHNEYQADASNVDADTRDHLNNLELLDDLEDDIHEDSDFLHHDDDQLFSDNSGDIDEITESPIQAHLLELLLSLYTHLPSGGDDKFWSPIIRFIILYSIRTDGRWIPAGQITQIFASLLFCGRLLMMALMHRQVLSNPGIRYSAYVNFIPVSSLF